jgi:hypothetical protein
MSSHDKAELVTAEIEDRDDSAAAHDHGIDVRICLPNVRQ